MATDGKTVEKWETVGKFKAKTRAQKQALSKTMLKADQLPLSTIQSPIFEGVNGKLPTNVPGKKLKSENNPVHKPPSNKQNIRKKPKKSANDNKFTFHSIEEAVKNEEVFTSIEDDLTSLKEKFPNNEITWLKEIAAHLDMRLSCPETTFTEQDFDFPINKANKNSHAILSKTFGKNVSKEVVPLIFQHYLTIMLECMGRDQPSWGYRICLQAITHSHPTICSENLEKHLEKMKTYANDVKRCRALLWAVGQVGLKDMRCGLKVWLHLHLPNLDMKKLAPYSMSYIERIMNKCQRNPEQFLSDCLLPKHFVKITELVNGNFPMKDRMQKIYPTFRHLITHNSMAKREFFNHLMKFSSVDEEVTNQLVKIGVTCLQEDPHCFAIWREHYSENTLQISKLLLEEMRERRPSIYQSMPLIAFEEAIRSFKKVNSDAASKSNILASKPQFRSVRSACETFCQDLIEQKKMNIDSKSKYNFYLTMVLLVLCGSLLYYDVTLHGSWATSATHKFLDSNGVLKFMEQIKMKTMNLYDLSANWLKNNIPYYWDMTKLHLGPYIAKLVEVGMDCWTWLGNVTKPALAALSYHCYDGLAKVESWSRTAASYCLHQWDDLVAFCWPYLVICAEHISAFYSWILDVARGEADWQSTSDNIHNFALNVVNMANAIVQNITKLVSNYIAPSQP